MSSNDGVSPKNIGSRRGAMIGANDLFIGAHARALGVTSVTNNTTEFERVKSLTLENWTLLRRRR